MEAWGGGGINGDRPLRRGSASGISAKYAKLTPDLRLRNGIRLPICARKTLYFIMQISPLIVKSSATIDYIPAK